jgi:hypothetical protein
MRRSAHQPSKGETVFQKPCAKSTSHNGVDKPFLTRSGTGCLLIAPVSGRAVSQHDYLVSTTPRSSRTRVRRTLATCDRFIRHSPASRSNPCAIPASICIPRGAHRSPRCTRQQTSATLIDGGLASPRRNRSGRFHRYSPTANANRLCKLNGKLNDVRTAPLTRAVARPANAGTTSTGLGGSTGTGLVPRPLLVPPRQRRP